MPKVVYRFVLPGALVVAAALVFFWLRVSRPAAPVPTVLPASPPAQVAKPTPPPPQPPVAPTPRIASPPPPPVVIPPDYYESVRLSPEQQELEEIALNLRNFGARFGGNPTGTNAEIVKTLNGGNPGGVRSLPDTLLRLNGQGELVDPWGTPYFFHQLSAQQTEIRSAGPDKTLWTQDDILSK